MATGYPFLDYINEDKSRYPHAKDKGYIDDDDLFLIGDSGGFLLNIRPGWKFVNTELFCEVADYYRKNKHFTSYKVDSIPHRQFRKREQYRRLHGFEAPCLMAPDGSIHNVRITGAHYNFLNYTMIEQLDETTIIHAKSNTAKKKTDFPKFLDSQFWYFHAKEFADNNGFNLLIDKTRRGGFSYMEASDSANAVNNQPRKVVIHVAIDKKYLTQTGGLSDFAINNFKFYEQNTPFKRGILSPVNTDFKLGFKLSSGVEADNSWHSSLISVSAANNPNCAIGKDAVKIKLEEVSTIDNFDELMSVTVPALTTGAYKTGTLSAWGTSTAGNMQPFERAFYNPKTFDFMPFENVWDRDSRHEVCGFFKSYAWGLQGELNGMHGVDNWGNSNINVSLEIAKRERLKKKESCEKYSDYINYLGQYALYPAESFSSATENIFSSEELSAWEEQLRINKDYQFYVDGELVNNNGIVSFVSNKSLIAKGKKVYDWIYGVPRKGNEDPHGCVRIWFPPERISSVVNGVETKVIPEGLYSISYDPVGIEKEKNEITNKHSHNSISVWMNPCALNGFKQKKVASYYGRPEKLSDADQICLNLAIFYNCIGTTNVEVNRGETVSNFRKWNALKYLSHEPLIVWDTTMAGKVSSTYGYIIGDEIKKLQGLRLLREMLYEEVSKDENGEPVRMFQYIFDYQSILELKKWNNKGNFDRVSEMIIRAIEYKALQLEAKNKLQERVKLTQETDNDDIFSRDWC